MNAKHSAILLSGLLLLMIGIAWADAPNAHAPTCPPLKDDSLQQMLQPEAWVHAYWDANLSVWQIQCNEIDAIANMPARLPANASNAIANAPRMSNAANFLPSRGTRRTSGNSNYVNNNPYKSPPDTNAYPGSITNAANANAVKPAKRRP